MVKVASIDLGSNSTRMLIADITNGTLTTIYKEHQVTRMADKLSESKIISKGISAGFSQNSYRGQVKIMKRAKNSRNFSQCDSLLLGNKCGAHTFPYIDVENKSSLVEHEATTSKIGEDQIFYCLQRGIDEENAIALIVNGYAKEVLKQLPMEFSVEAQKLLSLTLEGSVG